MDFFSRFASVHAKCFYAFQSQCASARTIRAYAFRCVFMHMFAGWPFHGIAVVWLRPAWNTKQYASGPTLHAPTDIQKLKEMHFSFVRVWSRVHPNKHKQVHTKTDTSALCLTVWQWFYKYLPNNIRTECVWTGQMVWREGPAWPCVRSSSSS